MENERKISDIRDAWSDKELFLHEGDIVLLFNWDSDNEDQVIGIAKLIWDSEDHCWDYEMIAGDYIEFTYDRWRQCPMIIGNTEDGLNKEFLREEKDLFRTNESWFDSNAWEKFLQKSVIKQNIKTEKKILRIKRKEYKSFEDTTEIKIKIKKRKLIDKFRSQDFSEITYNKLIEIDQIINR